MKHTPGPWHIEADTSLNQIGDRLIIRSAMPSKNLWDQVCEVGREGKLITGLMGGTAQANARLIAAAPEMLELLIKVSKARLIDLMEVTEVLIEVDKLIAKATGEKEAVS